MHVHAMVRPRALVVLGHGAGRGVDTDDLQDLAERLPSRGVSVVLVDQPWVVQGRRVASAPPALDEAWVPAVAAARAAAGASSRTPLVVGGRSAGARVACRTCHRTSPDALLLIAFPLLPPSARRSRETRDAALAARAAELGAPVDLGVPVVVAQGERDGFGTPDQVRASLAGTPAAALDVRAVPGADHGMRVRRGGPDPADALLEAALRAVARARGE